MIYAAVQSSALNYGRTLLSWELRICGKETLLNPGQGGGHGPTKNKQLEYNVHAALIR